MPRWKITVPAGFMLGLMLGVGLAFLLELIDSSIKSPSDITRKVDLPLLGMVPHAEDLDEEVSDMRRAFNTNPNSLLGEAFRQIHTCLLFSGPSESHRSVLVTSASPGDGRTTIAVNLAAATARAGRKVLLVDTNFRQPMVHQLFEQCSRAGLSDVLSGQAQWREVVCPVADGLSVMPAGTLPPNPAELLASEMMRRLITEMEQEYDQVIFDGAPVMLVTDPLAVSTMVDGVILVVRAGRNSHGLVQRSRDTLNRVGAHVLGVVLNAVRVTPGGYLRKNYEAYYDYHEQPEAIEK
jgi:capsular exopolysaccharide synthesis family protein